LGPKISRESIIFSRGVKEEREDERRECREWLEEKDVRERLLCTKIEIEN